MIVEARRLSVRYGTTTAVDAIDLTASPGSILVVVGPNGSGKSSLIKAIAGVVRSEGTLHFNGKPARGSAVSYMAQDIGGQAALTVLEIVLLGRLSRLGLRVGAEDLAAVERVMKEMNIEHLAARYLGELSGGQRQMIFLAQALVSDPGILLLDEPISALDLRHQLELLDLVRHRTTTRNLTTICVLHDLAATARIADRVAMLRSGRMIAEGPPAEIITSGNIAEVFEVDTEILDVSRGPPLVRLLRARPKSD